MPPNRRARRWRATSDPRAADEATAALVAVPPEPQRVNLYYWYYGTLALHHQQEASREAAAAWQAWNTALTLALGELAA